MESTTALPSGTVTFLFTDIEGNTKLWEQYPEAMRLALTRHDALAAALIDQHGGLLLKHRGEGDSLFAVFARATDALAAAYALQHAFVAETWQTPAPLRVRIALHTGEADLREGDYYGAAVNRCARLRAVAHGGQVLLSLATEELVREAVPEGASLRDLGLHRLRDLSQPERIFQLLHPDLPADFPPLTSLDALPNNLPAQLTSFVGRKEAMAEVQRLLATRLLTLTGSGGCGKTRLALQVAAEVLREYPNGVWLVELAALGDPALVPQTVAAALGVREEPGRPLTATLTDYLRPKALLLLLDNCEHLLAACAQLADTLLRACPSLRILASSREGLGIAGETTFRVPSLSLPDLQRLPSVGALTEFEAVRLFVERAGAAVPSFALNERNALTVASVCQRLDGIPLAIELAAARVKALSVEKLNERLDDMFRLLTGGSRTALPRQQTLRALIDWSYALLAPSERVLFRRLSVFAGGWTLEAAERVCVGEGVEEWEVLDLLTSLVEKSLVLYEEGGGEGRYRLLETVRQYARDRLLEAGEGATVRGRHRDWFLALAEQAEPALWGESERAWLDRLEVEHDNLRAALAWSGVDGQGEAGLRLGGALWRFWDVRGYWGEGRERLAELLALAEAQARTAARAKALRGAGGLAQWQGDYGAARALFEESLALSRELGDKGGIAWVLNSLGSAARERGDYGIARALFEESLALFRQVEDKQGIAYLLNSVGMWTREQGDLEAARALFEESLAIFRELGQEHGMAWSLGLLGVAARDQGDYGVARALFEEGLAIYRELGSKRGITRSLDGLGNVAREQGDLEAARALFEESLAIFRELGQKGGIVKDLEGLAAVAVAQAQSERAARLFGAAEGLREAMSAPLPPADRAEHDRCVEAVRTALGEEAFAAAWAEGRALSLEDAIKDALEETSST